MFNLVPAWYLDGHYFLAAALEVAGGGKGLLRTVLNGTSGIAAFVVLVSFWSLIF